MDMKKAVFIIPYFGKLPYYFAMWVKTASENQDYDFWVITDDNSVIVNSKNVKIINMPFAELTFIIQKKFDFSIGLKTPRKLCDFKPTYGYIFEKEIKDYQYWGYCDIDVVLGDLNTMIPIEAGYDKLFVHGHMTLFKNTHENNRMFMTDINYPETYHSILSDSENHIFDETSDGLNINLIFEKSKKNSYYDYNIADINPYSYLFKRSLYDYGTSSKKNRRIKAENIVNQIFYWDKGKLFRYALDKSGTIVVDEFRYFHFQKRNMQIGDILKCNSFIIVPNKMIPFEGEITKKLIQEYTKDKLIYPQYYRLKWKNLLKKLKR